MTEPRSSLLPPERDLVGDIQAQQRRKLFRRAGLVLALVVALLAIAFALKTVADRIERERCLDEASEGFARGTLADLMVVADDLDLCLESHRDDSHLLGARALARAQLLAEFGAGSEPALAALAALDDARELTHDGELSRIIVDLDDGALAPARERLATMADLDEAGSIAPHHEVWVQGMLAIADPEADLDTTIDEVSAAVDESPSISIRRLLAALHMQAGDPSSALEELGRAREQSRKHLGLAADEALYNAVLRQKLPGVADISEQLLSDEFKIAPRDRAHAMLARGVVEVQNGEIEAGMKAVDEAWRELPGWDKISRTLALEMAMEAGDGARARTWIDEAGLRAPESDIYEAWVKLVEGDVMAALAELATLPQEHPRVALLQGLALVEQGRWPEAAPWLERADKLLPGRVDVEVARARVEAQTADPKAARRKLEALAEEEPFAPRAWTGLGEAHLAVAWYSSGDKGERIPRDKPDASALKEARRAFKWAVQRERLPAEAYLQLAEITDRRRGSDPKLIPEVTTLLAKAVEANPKLPRYAVREALYLVEIGRHASATAHLVAVAERPGVGYAVPMALAKVALDRLEFDEVSALDPRFDGWMDSAQTLRAPAGALDLLRARALLVEGKPDGALTLLGALLSREPANVDAHVYLIRTHMQRKDRDAALIQVRAANKAIGATENGRIYLEWARVLARGGKRRPAASHAKTGWNRIREQPNVPVTTAVWAAETAIRLLQRDSKPKPAAVIGRQITELAPTHSDAWALRAAAELRSNRGSDAKASAEKAVELDAENPRAHEILGQLYLRFGRKDAAKAAFKTAAELGKDSPRAAEYKKNLQGL